MLHYEKWKKKWKNTFLKEKKIKRETLKPKSISVEANGWDIHLAWIHSIMQHPCTLSTDDPKDSNRENLFWFITCQPSKLSKFSHHNFSPRWQAVFMEMEKHDLSRQMKNGLQCFVCL